MKARVFLILIIAQCGAFLLAQGYNTGAPELRKNSVYLEFGDVISLPSFSINYDRTFPIQNSRLHSFGLRSGLQVTRWYKHENDFSIPFEGYYLLGRRFCFETGFNVAYCFGRPDFYAFGIRVGFRWRDESGVLVRLALTPTFANDGIEVYTLRVYGISMGYSF